jgi:hypothetical protein
MSDTFCRYNHISADVSQSVSAPQKFRSLFVIGWNGD